MEALKQGKSLTFKWGEDLEIYIKPRATSDDRLQVALEKPGLGRRFVLATRLMVIGWKGLTRDGEEVPYSPEALDSVPDIPPRNFIDSLGGFVWKNTDISGREDSDLKNASAPQLGGPADPAPSTVGATTV